MVSSEIIRGFIDSIILDIIQVEDNYGYEISKAIEDWTKGKYTMKEATLYAAFKRLESKGYVKSYMGNQTHGRKRKYYSITEIGLKYLVDKKKEWVETKRIIDRFLEEGYHG